MRAISLHSTSPIFFFGLGGAAKDPSADISACLPGIFMTPADELPDRASDNLRLMPTCQRAHLPEGSGNLLTSAEGHK